MSAPTFKPSDVRLWQTLLPLVSTFGRAELEMTAALMVLTSIHVGDVWRPLTMRQHGEALKAALVYGGALHHLSTNPFAPPPDHHRELVRRGFARWLGDPDDETAPGARIEFTDEGFAVLAKTVALPEWALKPVACNCHDKDGQPRAGGMNLSRGPS